MNKKELKKAMKGTCFKNLAYCCGLKKPCFARDDAMKRVGLTRKDYVVLKGYFDHMILAVKILAVNKKRKSKP